MRVAGGEASGVGHERDAVVRRPRRSARRRRVRHGSTGAPGTAGCLVDLAQAGAQPSGRDVGRPSRRGRRPAGWRSTRCRRRWTMASRRSSMSPTTSTSCGQAARWSTSASCGGSVSLGLARPSPAPSTMNSRRPVRPRRRRARRRRAAPAAWWRAGRRPLLGGRQPSAPGSSSGSAAVEDAGVAALEPVVEPGQRLDVQALPRPGQPELAEHRRPGRPGCPPAPPRRERRRAGAAARSASRSRGTRGCRRWRSSGSRFALVPPLVAEWVLDRSVEPQVVPRVRVVVELQRGLHHRDRRLAVHGGEPRVQRGACAARGGRRRSSWLRQNSSLRPEVSPTMARNGVTNDELNSPWCWRPRTGRR